MEQAAKANLGGQDCEHRWAEGPLVARSPGWVLLTCQACGQRSWAALGGKPESADELEMPRWEQILDDFQRVARQRMADGSSKFGDQNLDRAPPELLSEVLEELVDVANWAAMCFGSLRKLFTASLKEQFCQEAFRAGFQAGVTAAEQRAHPRRIIVPEPADA